MVKTPKAGAVKTRLAREIGCPRATSFYRHTTAAVLSRLAVGGNWQTILDISPDSDLDHPIWSRRLARIHQGSGDIGVRMQRAFRQVPPGPMVLIGSDIPAIRTHHIRTAFKMLARADAVFGPATDGGYWLVGMKRRPRLFNPFNDVRWSSNHALADTLRNLAGKSVATVETLRDVDDARDFNAARGWFGRRVLPTSAGM
ncbi:TIGR04282 family arsenosugar biosynthesis glycosyltransferase [Leptospira interrogans]